MISPVIITNETLPAILVSGFVPLPNNRFRIDITRKDTKDALRAAINDYNNYIVILVSNTVGLVNNASDYNEVGIIAKVLDADVNGNNINLEGIVRCQILNKVETNPYYVVDVKTMPFLSTDINSEIACVRMLIKELESIGPKIFKGNANLLNVVSKGVTADKLCDLIAFNMPMELNFKIRYLNNPSVSDRLTYILEDLKREKQVSDIENVIEQKVRDHINESQKEYYLREKMRTIQEELGDKAQKESDIEDLRQKIKDAKMPPNIEEKAMKELNRYITSPTNSAESGIIRDYLALLIDLPWYKEAPQCDDIKAARSQLDKDHYGLEKVKERVLEYLAVCILTKHTPQTILCLVGPPGVGKTSLARSIATALNRPFVKQSLGGMKDESEIRGHRRTYLGALPGRILSGMRKAKVVNPVFLLDEIDKLTSDYRGDPASALLEVLDGEQNKFFSDNYLEEPYDLSKVMFIATANYLENIPAALRDRLEIVNLSSYTEYEKFEIAKRHLIVKQLDKNGLDASKFVLSDNAILRIIREYTMEAGVRELERIIGSLIRKAIKSILEGENEIISIDENNLEKWLGKPKFLLNMTSDEDLVGTVNGLAYTQYGGDTMPIEVTYYPGTGDLKLTGKLGDVMKESAVSALSYVKSHASVLGIDSKVFKENDIHIHVPEGAVPKDGPSAGIALTTAIASAFTNRPVIHYLGMTGEITLMGKVLPIGGLREKAIAAHRNGLKKILIPMENMRDLDEIPESVKKDLEIIGVNRIDEVINIALK